MGTVVFKGRKTGTVYRFMQNVLPFDAVDINGNPLDRFYYGPGSETVSRVSLDGSQMRGTAGPGLALANTSQYQSGGVAPTWTQSDWEQGGDALPPLVQSPAALPQALPFAMGT